MAADVSSGLRWLSYQELESELRRLAATYPELCRLQSAGRSYQGRELWLLEITNQATGASAEKPGFYIDGNHHAGEVTGSVVCLYTASFLLTEYGRSQQVTDLLDQIVFYILPRVSPDGTELYLTTPHLLRSSVREWAFPEPTSWDGLQVQDIDGDGEILQMRVRDDVLGDWKVSSRDSRLLVKRGPDDWQGPFYRLYPEGRLVSYDGYEVKTVPSKWGLDLNRNYPTHWRPEVQGSGPYPFSEPETRAVGDFLLAHPNIAGALSYHTSGGYILRPFCTSEDRDMPREDLAVYKTIGERGKELTSYPCISIFENFTMDRSRPSAGSFIDFTYDYLGVLVYATELWDMAAHAGLPKRSLAERTKLSDQELEQDGLKLLEWNDQALQGKGFIPWREFQHPELGLVEIGGWLPKTVRQNAPLQFLEAECSKNLSFSLVQAAALPRLVLTDVQLTKIEGNSYRLTAVVQNAGYLRTSGSVQAERNRVAKPLSAEVLLPPGGQVLSGPAKLELGHLGGYAEGNAVQRRKVEWMLQLPDAGSLVVEAKTPRAGTARHEISF